MENKLVVMEESELMLKIAEATEKAVKKAVSGAISEQVEHTGRKRLRGMRELAEYLEVGLPTAQRLKDDGKIPFYAVGNRFFFYSDEVDKALRKET